MEKVCTIPEQDGFRGYSAGSVVLITAVDRDGRADVCTVGAWSLVNGRPILYGIAMCTKRIGPRFFKRYTTTCIEQTSEFVINVPHADMSAAWGVCGTVSLTEDPNADKFALARLTPAPATYVKAPLIVECPVNIECRVYGKLTLPSHDWIVGEPLAIHWAKSLIDGKQRLLWETAPRLS